MDESDTVGIVRRDRLSPEASDSVWGRCCQREAPSWRPSLFRLPPVSVEPVVVLTMFSVALHDPLSTQYLWARISEDLSYNHTRTSGCGSSESSHQDPLQKVQHVIVFGLTTEAHITFRSQVVVSSSPLTLYGALLEETV